MKRCIVFAVFLLFFTTPVFAARVGNTDNLNRVRFAECYNRPPVQYMLMLFDTPFAEIGTVLPSWATLASETPEEVKNLEDTFTVANFDIIITSNKDYSDALIKRELVKQRIPLWKERIILIGPAEERKTMEGLDASSAMRKIFSENILYFSLVADDCVREAETELLKPPEVYGEEINRGYVETTRDDVSAMFQASDEGACMLVGEASYAQYIMAQGNGPVLEKIVSTDYFRNTYACLVVNSGLRKVRAADAEKYMEWMQSGAAAGIISDFSIGGIMPFVPFAKAADEK